MSKKSEKLAEQQEAIASLKKMLKPGAKVYTVLRGNPAASGMSRVIDLCIVVPEYDLSYPLLPADKATYPGQTDYNAAPKKKLAGYVVRSIGWTASKAMGRTFDSDRQGIRIGGCGMDMGFSLVYDLGSTLWPKGTVKAHSKRNGQPDTSGGYALKQKWL